MLFVLPTCFLRHDVRFGRLPERYCRCLGRFAGVLFGFTGINWVDARYPLLSKRSGSSTGFGQGYVARRTEPHFPRAFVQRVSENP